MKPNIMQEYMVASKILKGIVKIAKGGNDAAIVEIYIGTRANFKHKKFLEACKSVDETICIVFTKNLVIYGMYTDIAWGKDNKYHSNKGNSFCFSLS